MTDDNTPDLRKSIEPKSDQLNADDLFGTTKDITVTAVRSGTAEQPITVHYEGEDGRPYKPCKSMRRVLVQCWGDDGRAWVGKSMRLYCDPEVMFGGVKVGGIRISHLSHITGRLEIMLTVTRSKRKAYVVEPLPTPTPTTTERPDSYPSDLFAENAPKWRGLIESGKMTTEQLIERAEQRAPLTDEQRSTVLSWESAEPSGPVY